MKVLVAGFLFLTAFGAQADSFSRSLCQKQVALEEQKLLVIKDRFQVGEVTRVDVADVEIGVLYKKFDCRAILFSEYCAAAKPVAQTLVDGMKAEAAIGQRTQSEVDLAQFQKAQVDVLCE